MDIAEVIMSGIGIVLCLIGYICSKFKRKAKIPTNYTEYIGICVKHAQKDGKFHEVFEIAKDGETIRYNSEPKSAESSLKPIDSIEKFYIDEKRPKTAKTAAEIAASNGDGGLIKRARIAMGIGLGLILLALILVMFRTRMI